MGLLVSHRVHGSLGVADNHKVNTGIKCQHWVSQAVLGETRTGRYNTSAGCLTAVVLGVASLAVTPLVTRTQGWVEGGRKRDGRRRGDRDRPVHLGAKGQWALQAAAVA